MQEKQRTSSLFIYGIGARIDLSHMLLIYENTLEDFPQ